MFFLGKIHLKWRFIAGNPSKSIVHMTVHRENIWKRRIFQQALLDRGMVALLDTWVQINYDILPEFIISKLFPILICSVLV